MSVIMMEFLQRMVYLAVKTATKTTFCQRIALILYSTVRSLNYNYSLNRADLWNLTTPQIRPKRFLNRMGRVLLPF